MSDETKKAGDWLVILFILIVSAAFFYGGLWIGIIVSVIGVIALGWSKRHEGPFPTNKSKK
jgi:hypothetical protein